jgi:L-asparaginase
MQRQINAPTAQDASGTASGLVVLLGTGGTIAGTATTAGDHIGYTAGQLGIAQLIAAVPPLAQMPLESHNVAQIDSKDMDHATWLALAQQVAQAVARPEVAGVVITHGTDTLEETAYFLQRVLAPAKPVVLTAAMRPATALVPDGPQNMLDAVAVARTPGASGVVAVAAGEVHSAFDVRKAHTYRIDTFRSGDAGVIAQVEQGRLRQHRPWPQGEALGLQVLPVAGMPWPRVEWITSHAGASGAIVRALVADGAQGFVVAGTGNGTLHHDLEAALREAMGRGVPVLRCTRCTEGVLLGNDEGKLPSAGALRPAQARIELMLRLMAEVRPPSA